MLARSEKPLDYRIWTEVDRAMDRTAPTRSETKDAFTARWQCAAKSLKMGVVARAFPSELGSDR